MVLKMKLCFSPIENQTNSYIDNMIGIIKDTGASVYSLEDVKKSFTLFREIDIFHFNWYENLNNSNYMKAVYSMIKKIITISIIKLFNKKIVWTMHNKVPHESINNNLDTHMIRFIAKKADKIVIHSKESINVLNELLDNDKIIHKTFYVHLINYVRNYSVDKQLDRRSLGIDNNELTFIFSGAIRKYKNVEILIKVFNDLNLDKCKLIISGKPHTLEYMQELNESINGNSNIITVFKFLSDTELFSLINLSDVLVLPYDKKSSLNSSSILLGFSSRRTVISPMIGTLCDMKDEDFYYGYDYEKDEEHYKRLKECIIRVYNDYAKNIDILNDKGEQGFSYVNKYYNYETVKKELTDLYTECLHN